MSEKKVDKAQPVPTFNHVPTKESLEAFLLADALEHFGVKGMKVESWKKEDGAFVAKMTAA